MPTTPDEPDSVRSPAAVNADIRALWGCGALSPEGEARYRELLVEWAAAIRADVVEAA